MDTNYYIKKDSLIINDILIGGIDGINLIKIVLINIIIPIILLDNNNLDYQNLILLVGLIANIIFYSINLLCFYISFELILIPKYYLIGYFGSRNKKSLAQNKFKIYTLIGSLFLLISLAILFNLIGSLDFTILSIHSFNFHYQFILFLGFLLAFSFKTPIFFLHSWLPLAHVESSGGVSVILAGIL